MPKEFFKQIKKILSDGRKVKGKFEKNCFLLLGCMQNLKKFHSQIVKQTQDISVLWSYFETQLRCHGNRFLKES